VPPAVVEHAFKILDHMDPFVVDHQLHHCLTARPMALRSHGNALQSPIGSVVMGDIADQQASLSHPGGVID